MSSFGKNGASRVCNLPRDPNEFSEKLIVKFKFSQEKAQAAVEEVRNFSRLLKYLQN